MEDKVSEKVEVRLDPTYTQEFSSHSAYFAVRLKACCREVLAGEECRCHDPLGRAARSLLGQVRRP